MHKHTLTRARSQAKNENIVDDFVIFVAYDSFHRPLHGSDGAERTGKTYSTRMDGNNRLPPQQN